MDRPVTEEGTENLVVQFTHVTSRYNNRAKAPDTLCSADISEPSVTCSRRPRAWNVNDGACSYFSWAHVNKNMLLELLLDVPPLSGKRT
jgi:hypothetical protein